MFATFLCAGFLRRQVYQSRALMNEVFSQAKLDVSLAGKEFARTLHDTKSAGTERRSPNIVVGPPDAVRDSANVLTLIYPR
jgi:hypothetical protein